MATPSKISEESKVKNFFRGIKAEMKKVIWPSKQELINYTGVVILISAAVAIVVGVLDVIIHRVLSFII